MGKAAVTQGMQGVMGSSCGVLQLTLGTPILRPRCALGLRPPGCSPHGQQLQASGTHVHGVCR